MAVEERPTATDDDEPAADRNGVGVEFVDGNRRAYAIVVRPRRGDWLHAERLVGEADGFDDEEFEAINPDAVRRIRSDRVHCFDGGTVHYGEGLLVDPQRLVAELGLD